MFLTGLEIKNYRSLENVYIDQLELFNVFIGRNNTGKSSIFNTFKTIIDTIQMRSLSDNILTDQSQENSLAILLTFKPRQQDREEFISLLTASNNLYTRLLNSPFLSEMQFFFNCLPGFPQTLYLHETKIIAEKGGWATIQKKGDNWTATTPTYKIVEISQAFESARKDNTFLQAIYLDVESSSATNEVQLAPNFPTYRWYNDAATIWPQQRLYKYLTDAFFFSTFRHSADLLRAEETNTLNQDGSNLAPFLHTLMSNYPSTFEKIINFIQPALPEIGRLIAPLRETNTEVAFFYTNGNYRIRLHDMGGGVEQLLLVAAVVLTTSDTHTLFLEEPENHLHAGAQRFLMERLHVKNRQVFLTTHSPTFINDPRLHHIYQVTYKEGRTKVDWRDADLAPVLSDIGIRRSDVLLSDSILFVEGEGDRAVFNIWSDKLNKNLEEHGVTILPMGGSRQARLHSEVLIKISEKSHIPHLILIDRDERSEAEIQNLGRALGTHLHTLQKREIENYFLVPRALLGALRTKHETHKHLLERIDQFTEQQVQQIIEMTANNLFSKVLLKRIRTKLRSLPDGLLPQEAILRFLPDVHKPELANILSAWIKSNACQYVDNIDIGDLVRDEQESLENIWTDPAQHLILAPGEEIIAAVFKNFESSYNKSPDATYIAEQMHSDEIHPEILAIIEKALEITPKILE